MKVKINIEFPINSSPHLLFPYLSTPTGLSEWFAEKVEETNDVFSFYWADSIEKAKLISKRLDEKVRFKWLDENDKETDDIFEFKISVDEITKDVSLIVIDMCDEDEVEDQEMLWENQIHDLKIILGSV
ncbi:START-like domain-containing protein [Capnocytophaga sp. ARDL2]|uniref:START-like domain-containing protein n=1 Tax=Capnocytophaga sp. ARDL2 TaxID=3238809 RepID=UPI003558D29F